MTGNGNARPAERSGVGERRRLGGFLIAFGLVGVVLFGAIAASLAVSVPSLANAGATQSSIETARRLADDSVVTLQNLDTALAHSSDALDSSAKTLNDLAATMRGGASALRISIFGQHPFDGVADQFDNTAARAAATAQETAATSLSVAAMRASIALMIADLIALQAQLAQLDGEVGWLASPLVWFGVLLALLWLLALAALVTWSGWQLRRGRL